MYAIDCVEAVFVVVAADEKEAVTACDGGSVSSRFGQESHKLPAEDSVVKGCRIDAGIVSLVARRGEITSSSHHNIVAYLSCVTCRYAKRIARFRSREAEDIANALR